MYASYATTTREEKRILLNAAVWADVHKEHKREIVSDRTGEVQQQGMYANTVKSAEGRAKRHYWNGRNVLWKAQPTKGRYCTGQL